MDTSLHIDYLSISTPVTAWGTPRLEEQTEMDYYEQAAFACLHDYPSFTHHSHKGVREDFGGAIGFRLRRFFPTFGWMLFGGAAHGRILIQLPGESCHGLRLETGADGESIGLKPLLLEGRNRFTRIDVAANWKIGASVDSVASAFKKVRLTDFNRYSSKTGVTQWLSAETGERLGLVYRYFSPHPRSDWLRVEFRLFGSSAENLRKNILKEGMLPPYKRLLADWGFDDPNMVNALGVGLEGAKIAYQKRQKAGSVRWLFGTALKSVRTAVRTGLLSRQDVLDYLDENRW